MTCLPGIERRCPLAFVIRAAIHIGTAFDETLDDFHLTHSCRSHKRRLVVCWRLGRMAALQQNVNGREIAVTNGIEKIG